MEPTIQVLHLENNPNDAQLVQAKLSEAGLSCRIIPARTQDEFERGLDSGGIDIILADHRLPMYDGMSALRLANELQPDIPFIFVSSALGEETAIEALTRGATDYVLKQNLSRLAPAIRRALREARTRLERKQAEKALKESEGRFRTIVKNSTPIIFLTDQEGKILLTEGKMLAGMGLQPGDLVGQSVFNIWQDYPAVVNGFRMALSGKLFEGIIELDELIFEVFYSPHKDSDGNIIGVIGMGLDITERKQADRDRLENLRFLENMDKVNRSIQGTADLEEMTKNLLDAVLSIFDGDRAYVICPCDPDARTWDYIIQREKLDYPGVMNLHLELPTISKVADTLRILLASESPVAFGPGTSYLMNGEVAEKFGVKSALATAIYPKTGSPWQFGIQQCSQARVWSDEEKRLFQEIGRRLADGLTSILIYRDLQDSELRYRSLVENVPDFISRFDTKLRFLYVNPAIIRAFDFPLEFFLGKKPSELPLRGIPNQNEFLEKKIREAIDTGNVNRIEAEWPTHEGDRWFEIIHIPEKDEKGTIVSVLGITRDITDQKLAERERASHLDFFKNMDRINRAIQGAENLEHMMRDVLETVLSIFDCDRAFLMYPCDPDSQTWFVPMERNKPEYPGVLDLNLKMPMDPQVSETLRILLSSDGPVTFGPGTPYALPEDVSKQFGFKCFMAMAIYPKTDSPWQFGIHQCSHTRTWTPEEKRLFQEIGRRLVDGLTSMLISRDLRKNEDFLNKILENIPDMIFVKEAEALNFVRFNQAGEKLLGYSRDELLGKNDYDFFPKEEADFFANKDREVLNTKAFLDIPEEKILTRSNDERILHTKKIPILDETGKPQYLLGISEDITDRKEAEDALALKNRINEILLAFPGKEMYWEILQVVLELAKSPYGYFGYLDEEGALVVPTLTGEVWETCQVPGKSIVFPRESWGDSIWGRVIREKRSIYSNVSLAVPEGHIPIKRALGIPMIYQAEVIGHFLVANRQTDYDDPDRELLEGIADLISPILYSRLQAERQEKLRKRSEAEIKHLKNHLANIIDSMPSMLVGIDNNEIITQWNRQVETTTGIPAAVAIGKPVKQMFPDLSFHIEAMIGEIKQRRTAVMEKLPVEKEEERRLYDLMLYPLITNGTEGAVLRIEDVTEQARIQNLMIQTEKMMSLGGLAAGMAHEINNPLGIITQAAQNLERRIFSNLKTNLEMAEETGVNLDGLKAYFEKRQIPEFIGSIREASKRASRIIENILKFSRRGDSVMQPVSLASVIDQVVELAAGDYDLKKKYDFKSIEILRDYEPNLPMVPMVSVEIEQVLLNLLKNSAEVLRDNPLDRKPRIFFRLRREERYILIEVADNGHGMDENTRLRVFEPFYTTKEPGIGTGLGLSVAYMIVTQNHKGLMEVESTPGKGTCFRVRLPLMRQ